MSIRRAINVLALSLLLLPSACRSVPQSKAPRDAGYDYLHQRDFSAAESKFKMAAATATTPEEKAEAALGLGMVYLDGDNAPAAVQQFYAAQRLQPQGDPERRAERGLGLAYYRLGDYALSRRYLEKGMKGTQPGDLQTILAKLVVCCRALDDIDGAARYRGRLDRPFSASVETILASTPRRKHVRQAGRTAATGDACPPGCPSCTISPSRNAPEEPPRAGAQPKLTVLWRSLWGARPTRNNVHRMLPVDKITVHHTAGPDFWGNTRAEAAKEIRNIQKFHQNTRHWADIGYHYIIDRSGNVWQGRPLRYQGAHANGTLNRGNIGIALLGNFCRQRPSLAQYQSLSLLLDKLCTYFHLPPSRIYTHRELNPEHTRCPGPALSACVDAIREKMRRSLVSYRRRKATSAATQR